MRLSQIRTFLEVCQTRHFGRAADNLHVTTSAVSTRVRLLEEELNTTLFVRLRNGIQLTDAAERLIPYCRTLISTWEQARFSVTVEADPRPNLTVLAAPGVWESVDPNWVKRLIGRQADIRLRLETAHSPQIISRLQQNSADIGLLMEPHSGADVKILQVGELELTLVSDTAGRTVQDVMKTDYLHVDWSTSFNTQFLSVFSDYLQANVTVSTAKMAADLLLDFPGAAYLSRQLIERLGSVMALYPVHDAPRFRIPVFAIYAAWSGKPELIERAISFLEFP